MQSLHQTEEFMRAAGQTIPAVPTAPDVDTRKLRLSLILEELYELAQAYGLEGAFQKMMANMTQKSSPGPFWAIDTEEYNALEALDAHADLRVVCDGAVLASGLHSVFPDALDKVHRSNMSKFCTTQAEADATMMKYGGDGVHCNYSPINGGYVVLRRSDNKVLKSIHYSPANLAPLLSSL